MGFLGTLVLLLGFTSAGPLAPAASAAAPSATFLYTGSSDAYAVPSGYCALRVELFGGQGADPGFANYSVQGGAGGAVVAELPIGGSSLVQAGDRLDIFVGASGLNGGLGGSPGGAGQQPGGGATTLFDGANLLAVAGGGGASPFFGAYAFLGAVGGAGGLIGTPGDNGGIGGSANADVNDAWVATVTPAGGGTLTGPGAGATSTPGINGASSNDGSLAVLGGGGAGRDDGGLTRSGGGGGGYYGGGGGLIGSYPIDGGSHSVNTAGGGGSSYLLNSGLPDLARSSSSLGLGGDGSARFTPLACQTLSFPAASADQAVVGGNYDLPQLSDQGGAVSVSVDPSSSAICTVLASTVTFNAVGTCKVNATAGLIGDFGTSSTSTSIAVQRGLQQLNLSGSDLSPIIVGAIRELSVSSDADVLPNFTAASQTPGTCSVTGLSVTAVAVGGCSIQIHATGTVNFAAASVSVDIAVQDPSTYGPGIQEVDLRSLDLSDLPVDTSRQLVLSSDVIATPKVNVEATPSEVCSADGASGMLMVSADAVGECSLSITVDGNQDYQPATTVVSLLVTPGDPHLSGCAFADTCTIPYRSGAIPLSFLQVAALGGPVGAFSWLGDGEISAKSLTPAVCTLKHGGLRTLKLGLCKLKGSLAASQNFKGAGPVTTSLFVDLGYAAVDFPSTLERGHRYQATFVLFTCDEITYDCSVLMGAKQIKSVVDAVSFWPVFLKKPVLVKQHGATVTVAFKVPKNSGTGSFNSQLLGWSQTPKIGLGFVGGTHYQVS